MSSCFSAPFPLRWDCVSPELPFPRDESMPWHIIQWYQAETFPGLSARSPGEESGISPEDMESLWTYRCLKPPCWSILNTSLGTIATQRKMDRHQHRALGDAVHSRWEGAHCVPVLLG